VKFHWKQKNFFYFFGEGSEFWVLSFTFIFSRKNKNGPQAHIFFLSQSERKTKNKKMSKRAREDEEEQVVDAGDSIPAPLKRLAMAPIILTGVTKLLLSGFVGISGIDKTGRIYFSPDGIKDVKVEQKGGDLIISGGEGGGGGGGMTFINNSGSYVGMQGMSISSIGGGSSCMVINGHRIELRGDTLYMDGKRMVPAGEVDKKEKAQEKPEKVYQLAQGTKISDIVISGSGGVTGIHPLFLNSHELYLKIRASGSISLPVMSLDFADAAIVGSGSVSFGRAVIKKSELSVTGSGSIDDFVVSEACAAKLTGSGSIMGSKQNHEAIVSEHKTGSGSIRIR
jgi:hypothetical protein